MRCENSAKLGSTTNGVYEAFHDYVIIMDYTDVIMELCCHANPMQEL